MRPTLAVSLVMPAIVYANQTYASACLPATSMYKYNHATAAPCAVRLKAFPSPFSDEGPVYSAATFSRAANNVGSSSFGTWPETAAAAGTNSQGRLEMRHSASMSRLGDSSPTYPSDRGERVAKHRRSTEAAIAVYPLVICLYCEKEY